MPKRKNCKKQNTNPINSDSMEKLFIDMDNVLVDFASGLEQVGADVKAQYETWHDGTLVDTHYDDIPGIFALMRPMPGAIEAVKTLATRYDLYILSTAPWNNPSAWSDKLEWVKRYFGNGEHDPFYKRLILSHHKDLCLQPDSWLIDDRDKNGASAFQAEGRLLRFGKGDDAATCYPDWPSVTAFLMHRSAD